MATTDERKARLAAELRANLHRRKAQARASADAVGERTGADTPAPDAHDQPVR